MTNDPNPALRGPGEPLTVLTLVDGGQPAQRVADWVAEYVSAARTSLDIAVYDFALSAGVMATVGTAIRDAAGRGVRVRLAHNAIEEVDPAAAIPVPGDPPTQLSPPSRSEPAQLQSLGVPLRSIPGLPDLMHHKFVVRDGSSVWTGSLNWTDDSWTREENIVVIARSPQIAAAFERDFADLWTHGVVQRSGMFDTPPALVGGAPVRPWFAPGRGRRITHRIATAIGRSDRRVRIASPVITAGPIIGTLAEVALRGGVDLAGVVDATQMRQVLGQWRANPAASWKPVALRSILDHAPFAGKVSTPWRPDSTHDYMHAKVTVADDVVFLGSYNLSNAGQDNAENVLEISDPALAERMATFVDELRLRYPPLKL